MKTVAEIELWIEQDQQSLDREALSGDQKRKLELEIGVLEKVLA